MSKIITRTLVLHAITLTQHSASAILRTEGVTWGPKSVNGYVRAYGQGETILFCFDAEENAGWDPEWGKLENFKNIAARKLDVVMKHRMNTSVIVALYPALLEEGDFLYAGGAYRAGIGGASASGAKAWADEAIAEIILTNLNMLIQLEKDRRIQAEKMEI